MHIVMFFIFRCRREKRATIRELVDMDKVKVYRFKMYLENGSFEEAPAQETPTLVTTRAISSLWL